MFKRALTLVVTAAMALVFSGCNTDSTEATASVYTRATESTIALTEDGRKAVGKYMELLKSNKMAIQGVEKTFDTATCGLYDINSDGIPEFYFFAAADPSAYSATFFVYSYVFYSIIPYANKKKNRKMSLLSFYSVKPQKRLPHVSFIHAEVRLDIQPISLPQLPTNNISRL